MADCVWCQNADINEAPPCEWVKENLNKSEVDFTAPFPCAGTKAMYESGNWGNTNTNVTYQRADDDGALAKI